MAPAPGTRAAAGFFAATLAWSWTAWLAAAALDLRADELPGTVLFLIGGAGPGAVALIVVGRARPPTARRRFLRRIVDPRPIAGVWLAAVVIAGLAPAVAAAATAEVLGGGREGIDGGALAIAGVLGFALVAGLAEEPGWRGFALDALEGRWSLISAGALVGLVWIVWHLPLYLLPGTFHHDLGLGSLGFWAVSATLLPLSVLMAWIVAGTGRSILAAVLVHGLGNAGGELLVGDDPEARIAQLVATSLLAAAAVGVERRRRPGPPRSRRRRHN